MSEWKEIKLGDIVTHKKGIAFKSSWFGSSGCPVVKVSNFTDNSIDIRSCTFLKDEYVQQYREVSLKTNDIIIATVGSWENNPESVVGKVIRVPEDANNYLLNQNAVRLRCDDSKKQIFLYYLLKNSDFFFYIIKRAQGSANQASITLTDIFGFKFLIPSDYNELTRIAKLLNNLDAKIENLRRQNETLEQIAQTLFKCWFIDFEFPFDFDQGKPKADGKPYKSSGGAMFASELGDIPEGWKVGKLGDEFEILMGQSPSGSSQKC